MRKVQCYECGKRYDYDMDDFCPKCGAFTLPERSTRIDANGFVVRVDGINEANHKGSFVHAELHEENRERRGSALVKPKKSSAVRETAVRSGQAAQNRKKQNPANVIFKIIFAIIVLNILSNLFYIFL